MLINGKKEALFAGAFGIFGHGNVACIGQALEENQDKLTTYRGHHEQNMALTGIAFARAKRRKQIFVATSSVGPGSTNMVTAAAVAMSNRLPILFLPGDTYANRMPDPVLQQVENFGNPGITQNDAFKPIVNFIKKMGSVPALQLAHAGRKAGTKQPWRGGLPLDDDDKRNGYDAWDTIAPSAIPLGEGWKTPKAMDKVDINKLIEAYVKSAKRALKAGFQAI